MGFYIRGERLGSIPPTTRKCEDLSLRRGRERMGGG